MTTGREGDGFITVEDLGSAMRLMGKNPSKTHLQQLIELVDSDGDGMLDFEDFLRMMVLCNLKDENTATDDERDEEEEEEEEEGDDGEEGEEEAEEDAVRVPRDVCA
jgi:Ca2+-binding EF-hand superfamily protein